MPGENFTRISAERFINLETYRKSGASVRTPVWFAESGGRLYIYSAKVTGKVKRIRREGRVRLAVCSASGKVRAEWMDARARVVEGEEHARGIELLNRKYTWQKGIIDFFSRMRGHKPVVIVIESANG